MNIKNLVAVAAIAASAMVSTRSFADTTIAENVTLNADTDWRAGGVVTVPDGVTVDLNGYTLWVSGLAGSGTFTSSVPDPTTFDLTTAQTDDTRVKSYTGGTDQALGTEFAFTIAAAWKAFADYPSYDFDNNHRTLTEFKNGTSDPIDIVYEFDAATAVNSYKIQVTYNAKSYLKRSPRTWKFLGSVSGADGTWVELDSREDVTDWAQYEQRPFTFFNDTAYKFYRLRIIKNGGDNYLEFFKLEYGRVQNQVRLDLSQSAGFASFAAASNTVSGTAKFVIGGGTLSSIYDLRGLNKVTLASNETLDLAGHYLKVHAIDGTGKLTTSDTSTFSDLTTPDRAKNYATATSNGSVLEMAGNGKYPASAAFDDSLDTSVTGDAQNPCHFAYYAGFPAAGIEMNYDFGTPTYVNRYRIMGTCYSIYPSVPKSWAFEGSNDGVTWTTLDERTNQALVLNVWSEYTFFSSECHIY